MLCPRCRRQLQRDADVCGACGTPLPGARPPLELVVDGATRIPLVGDLTIGRAPGSTLRLDDPTVSRTHARIRASAADGARLEDAGSSHGTFLDGRRLAGPAVLHDGARIQLGNVVLPVRRRRDEREAGHTIVVPPGASLVLPAAGAPALEPPGTRFGTRPRLRAGCRVKRLGADEGSRRWVVQDPASNTFLHVGDDDGALLPLLDGTRSLGDLVGEAERRIGADGAALLARLLAELGDRGLLSGVTTSRAAVAPAPEGRLRRMLVPREWSSSRAAALFAPLYRRGGWVLFSRPAAVVLAALAAAGLAAAVALVAGRYGTPFVVASHLGLGGLVFLAGRALIVAVHELAHGLALASFGRSPGRAGIKLLLVFPYVFVDTSESWFEPRRRRIAIAAAGPAADLCCGGAFALLCLGLPAGTARDVAFQVAFAAYVGACFNLNPFLDRDGYHILVDVLREPGLRARARAQLTRRLAGRGRHDDDPALTRYAIAGAIWSIIAAGLAILVTLRYEPVMEQFAPAPVVWIVLGTLWAALFVPVALTVGRPLAVRLRSG